MAKKVAGTLEGIQASEIYNRILDPKDPIDDVVEDMKKRWAYDFYGRRPAPALLEDGALKVTDLDMACLLSALADRGAVISIPFYKSRRPKTYRDDEWVVSAGDRHGKIMGLTSNKDVFSFSTLIVDANVVKRAPVGNDEVGAFRNFMVVDMDGHFYDGWREICFVPTRKENAFIIEKGLWTGNKIYFKNFVHPNRWVSFYGQPYVLTKILIARLKEEARDAGVQLKLLESAVPAADESEESESERVASGPSASERVKAFEAAVDAPVPTEGFPSYLNANAARTRLKKLRYVDVPALQFAIRATELAFCQRARSFDALGDLGALADEPFPAWITGAKFEDHAVKRTTWRRLVLHQRAPFAPGLALKYRVRWKSERVAA
jgi:hypothetical protein